MATVATAGFGHATRAEPRVPSISDVRGIGECEFWRANPDAPLHTDRLSRFWPAQEQGGPEDA